MEACSSGWGKNEAKAFQPAWSQSPVMDDKSPSPTPFLGAIVERQWVKPTERSAETAPSSCLHLMV